MKKFSHVPHTADIAIKVEADKLEGLFEAGVDGMMDFLKPGFCQEATASFGFEETIELASMDATTLLVDFMSEVLTLCLTEYVVICDVALNITGDKKISAIVKGYEVDAFDEDIKGVTYHDAEVLVNKAGNFETLVILDI